MRKSHSVSIISMDSKLLLVFVAALCSAQAFKDFVPEGKELVYHYHGLIRAGSHSPISFASAFALDGNVHMQNDGNSSYVHFSNLKYKMYNGKYDDWHEFDTKMLPLPTEMAALEKTFKIVYEPCGHTMGIAVEENEPHFVVNMKKGLASMLQLYTEPLKYDSTNAYSYHGNEQTLYGKGKYYYNVYKNEQTKSWTIEKLAEPHTTFHMYNHMATNQLMGSCEVEFDEPLTRDNGQVYKIIDKEGHKVVETIETDGGLYYTPLQGLSYAQHVYANITMELLRMEAATDPMKLGKEWYHPDLTYYYGEFDSLEGVQDITHGRRPIDMEHLLKDIEEMLYETVMYLKTNHLDMEQPNFEQGQTINSMLRYMVHLDVTSLETMTGKLSQKTTDDDKSALHIWYHMLPLVGSHASYMYIMKIVKDKKVKDVLAVEMLRAMSMNVKEPTSTLVDHMSEMLNWPEDLNVNVRKAAVLSFGAMINRATARHQKLEHHMNWPGHEAHEVKENFSPDYHLDKAFPSTKYYEKYIDLMAEKLKAQTTMQWKLVYISALYNTKMEYASHVLIPIAKGHLFQETPYVRFMAIMSLGPLINHKNEDLIYETFWPIMGDPKLQTSLRIAAYYTIMKSQPSFQRIINMFWQMEEEDNPALYQFHYKFMKTVSTTTNPCWQTYKRHILQVLRYTSKPEFRGMTGFYSMDFMDTKYDYGMQFGAMVIETPWDDEKIFKLKAGRVQEHAFLPMASVMIRTEGIDASIVKDVMLNMKDNTKNLNMDKLVNAFKGFMTNPDFKIEVALMKNGIVTMWYHVCAENIQDLQYIHDFIFGEKFNYIKKYFHVDYPLQHSQIIPTDIGFPALFVMHVPKVYNYDYKITKEVVNKMITYQYDVHLNEYSHSRSGFKFYNPFADVFQGIYRIHSYDKVEPIYFDLSLNPTQQSLKFSWKRHEDRTKDIMGFKSHVASVVFVQDDMSHKALQQSYPEGRNIEMVTFGKKFRENKILRQVNSPDTGLLTTVALIDSEVYHKNVSIMDPFKMHHISNNHLHVGHMVMKYIHAMINAWLQPEPYTTGILYKKEPSIEHPVTNVDVNLRVAREYIHGDHPLTPQSKYNVRATLTVNNNEKRVRTWDVNMNYDLNMGHILENCKLVISHINPKQEWRVCVDGQKKHKEDAMEGLVNVAMAVGTDAKCTADDKVMIIAYYGEQSEEQKNDHHIYAECQEFAWSFLHEQHDFKCYLARDSMRKYTYDIQLFEMNVEFKKWMHMFGEWFRFNYMKYLTDIAKPSYKVKDGLNLVFRYPTMSHVVDMEIRTPDHDMKFGGVPTEHFLPAKIHLSKSRHFSWLFKLMHYMSWTKVCYVNQEELYTMSEEDIDFTMPNEWTLYSGVSEDSKDGIWMKNLPEDFAAFKMVYGDHNMEIVPIKDKQYEITIDGQKLPAGTYQSSHDWVYVDWVDRSGIVSIICKTTGSHILYDGHHLFIETPNIMDATGFGHCINK